MLTPNQQAFLVNCYQAATAAGHIFPAMAASEAALESNWGLSRLAMEANNLFGQKQSHPPIYETYDLPTRELVHGNWVTVQAAWVKFPSLSACFKGRMDLLRHLAGTYPDYALALAADDPAEYVTEVSKTWSTDPKRAEHCIQIYVDHAKALIA